MFAAGARHRDDRAAIDAAGLAKLLDAADRFEVRRFVLCTGTTAAGHKTGLGAGQPENPPPNPAMLFADAVPLDAAVDDEGEGSLPPAGNDDPAPRRPLIE